MTLFRPCIDLHQGKVKQIVGSTLNDVDPEAVRTNFTSEQPSEWFAKQFACDQLFGGHVIMLGAGNENAAQGALSAFPGGLHIGGGITVENAASWIAAGASHVIVTSWLFDHKGTFIPERLHQLVCAVGSERIVIDMSCRRAGRSSEVQDDSSSLPEWHVTFARWQKMTSLALNLSTLQNLAPYCDEFLIHAADLEGKRSGMDVELIVALGEWCAQVGKKCTYAGGASSLADLNTVQSLSKGRVDLTIGSALDIFGGQGVRYSDCVDWNNQQP